jgi:large subunit ribosomal protein L21
MFAVIQTGGKQYKAEKGTILEVEKLDSVAGSKEELRDVLLLSNDSGAVSVGAPFVQGASVLIEIVEHLREDKIIVFKKKQRANYRRKHGHRQCKTKIRVLDIICASNRADN